MNSKLDMPDGGRVLPAGQDTPVRPPPLDTQSTPADAVQEAPACFSMAVVCPAVSRQQ
jgi:hypothetical protein